MKKIISSKSPQLEAAHPSSRNASGGFIGCGHFMKINKILISQGKTPIDWRLD
jgi:uracil-DNA glycosylase